MLSLTACVLMHSLCITNMRSHLRDTRWPGCLISSKHSTVLRRRHAAPGTRRGRCPPTTVSTAPGSAHTPRLTPIKGFPTDSRTVCSPRSIHGFQGNGYPRASSCISHYGSKREGKGAPSSLCGFRPSTPQNRSSPRKHLGLGGSPAFGFSVGTPFCTERQV